MREIIIASVSAFIGYFFKYLFDKKFFLYKKKLKAKEKLRDAVNILLQGEWLLCGCLRNLNLEKIKTADPILKENVQKGMNKLEVMETIKKTGMKLQEIKLYDEIKPYISNDLWKLFYGYMSIITHAATILSFTPHCLDAIKEDNIKKDIIKNVIPIIPEDAVFIKKNPILNVFFSVDLVRKKLLKELESIKIS